MPNLDPDSLTPRQIAWGLVRALLALGVIVVLIAVFLKEPAEALASDFVGRFGLPGVFVGALVLDAVPGFGSQPVVMLATAGGQGPWQVWVAAGVGSWLSGSVGWVVGRGLSGWAPFRRWLARFGLEAALAKHGRRAIFIASLAPFPYGLVTLAAGASGVRWTEIAIGATGRFIKVGLNVLVVVMGWSAA